MLPLVFFKKVQNYSENLFIFSKKQKYFENFEKAANFNCIQQQNCHIQSFQSEFIFFGESMYFFITAKSLKVLRIVSVSVEFYCKLLPPANFYNFEIFVRKTHFFKLKKPEVWTFWGLLQFQSILRQVCCLAFLKDFSCSGKTEKFFNTSKSRLLIVLRKLTVPFIFNVKLAKRFSRSWYQIGSA